MRFLSQLRVNSDIGRREQADKKGPVVKKALQPGRGIREARKGNGKAEEERQRF